MDKRIAFYKSLFALKPQSQPMQTQPTPTSQFVRNSNKLQQTDKKLEQLQERTFKQNVRQMQFVVGKGCGSCGGAK